jgi:hypothetical protein
MKYIKLFENFEKRDLGVSYRLSGSNEYNNLDMIDINENTINILQELFNKNNMQISLQQAENSISQLSIVDSKIVEIPATLAKYLHVAIRTIRGEKNSIVFQSYFNIYAFNDGMIGLFTSIGRNTKMYICDGMDGLLKLLNDFYDL